MMVVVLLLALVGSCWGLQPKLEYQYRYYGRVASGIPSVKNQFSGAGIQADVTVQMSEVPVILVQISNVQVGDMQDELKCDLRNPLPIEYHPLVEGVELLEKPFVVHLNDTEEADYMEAPVEPTWITNIRRSIVNIFRVAPLRVNFGIRGHEYQRPSFGVTETTMSGHCWNWYSLLRLPEEEAALKNKEQEAQIEDDIQRDQLADSYTAGSKTGSKTGRKSVAKGKTTHGKTSQTSDPGRLLDIPTINDGLWTMVRTVDFNLCEDLVALKLHGHKKTDERISRSSVGTYLLRGDESGWRIERAVIEGSVSVFADAAKENHVDTFTNQTLELRAVRILREQLPIDYEPHHDYSWQYGVDHHLPDTLDDVATHPSIEQVVTGVTLTEGMVSQAKLYITEQLESTISHLTPKFHVDETTVSESIGRIADAVGLLSLQEIKNLEDLIPQDDPHHGQKINILYQAYVVAATGPSISYIIEKMKDYPFRERHAAILSTLFVYTEETMKNPLIIQKITELVLNLPWDGVDQYLKPVGLMSVAKLANKFCLNAGKRETFGSNTCDPHHVCNADQIIDVLLPALIQGAQAMEEPVWKRIVYVQALANLGAPQSIATLKHIIYGERESHIGVRVNAIMSLSPTYMPKTVYHTAFKLLMPIFDNVAELSHIRNIAFLVMSMWESRITWWQRMATSTWHEPSSQVASFVSTAITSLARGEGSAAKKASKVVHLVKPASSHSLTSSSLTFLHEYFYNCELEDKIAFAWLASTQSLFPANVLLKVQYHTITGLPLDARIFLHQNVLSDVTRILGIYKSVPSDAKQGDTYEIVAGMFEQVKEQLGIQPPTREHELSIWLRVQHVYMIVQGKIFDETATYFSPDTSFYSAYHSELSVPSFWRDVDSTIALPTDVGLPILIKYAEQYAFWINMEYNIPGQSSAPKKIKSSLSLTNDLSSDSILEARTLLPWSQKFAVGAGSHNIFSILLPLHLHGSVDVARKVLRFTVEPLATETVEILMSHNHPYTILTGPFPTAINHAHHIYKKVMLADTELYMRHARPLPAVVGLDVETIWSGDIDFPVDVNLFLGDMTSLFIPSYKTWNYRILFNPQSSSTKSITIIMAYETLKKSANIEVEQTFQDLGQETQGKADVDFSDFSQIASSGQQEFDEVDTFQVEQTSQSRAIISKLQQEFLPVSGGSVETVSVRVEVHGEPTRSYETVLTWIIGTTPAHDVEQAKSFAKLQLTLLENVPEGFLGQPQVTCVKLQVQRPGFLPLASLQEVLRTNFQTLINGDVYTGVSCEETPILTIKGSMSVSEEGLRYVRDQVTPEGPGCDGEPVLHPLDVITKQIYDRAHLNITWTEDFSESIVNLTYYADDLLHCALFSHKSVDHTARHPGHLVDIDATKNPTTNHWTVRTTRPQEVSVIHDLVIPPPLESFFTPAGVTLTADNERAACVMERTQVRTFDGVVMPFEPSNCWVTAVIFVDDPSHGGDFLEGLLQVRFTDNWDVRIIWPPKSVMIEFNHLNVLVNGVEFEGADDDIQVHRTQDGLLITFIEGIAIRVSDKVEFVEAKRLRSKVQGLCGNMDGETSAEMVGPLGCLYTDPTLYALAWTTPGDVCNSFSLTRAKSKVERFQETCKKRTHIPTGVSHLNALHDCSIWVYQERTYDNYVCKALVPTLVCKPGFKAMSTITEPIEYDCEVLVHYHQQAAVPKKCYSHTLSTTYPSTCVPSYG